MAHWRHPVALREPPVLRAGREKLRGSLKVVLRAMGGSWARESPLGRSSEECESEGI